MKENNISDYSLEKITKYDWIQLKIELDYFFFTKLKNKQILTKPTMLSVLSLNNG